MCGGGAASSSFTAPNSIPQLEKSALNLVTQGHIPAKKIPLNDKPMTIEVPLFLEYSGDRPIGHPQSATRSPG
jgi:hypothetical protein